MACALGTEIEGFNKEGNFENKDIFLIVLSRVCYFIKICQNAPHGRVGMNVILEISLLWCPPARRGGARGGEREFGIFTPTLILPHQGGGDVF